MSYKKQINNKQIFNIFLVVIFTLLTFTFYSTSYFKSDNQKVIYAITPTYDRPHQIAELTRLSQLVMLVPEIHWIIIEDASFKNIEISKIINQKKLSNRKIHHLNCLTVCRKRVKRNSRGSEQRNYALKWLRKNVQLENSIVYFMDDDNTYSLELFEEMKQIEINRVGVWPVGLVGGQLQEGPNVTESTVIGFNSQWFPDRPFPIDMAGFAIHGKLLTNANIEFDDNTRRGGLQESSILSQVTRIEDLQPLADQCTKVLVWHTQTKTPKLTIPYNDNLEYFYNCN